MRSVRSLILLSKGLTSSMDDYSAMVVSVVGIGGIGGIGGMDAHSTPSTVYRKREVGIITLLI